MNFPTITPLNIPGARYRALDGLRGMAAILVVLLHVEWANHITSVRFVQNGYLAVDLFFILSGLVISANYSTRITNTRTALHFIALRFFRLYPLHFALLAAFVGLECFKSWAQSTLGIMPEHPPFTGGQSVASLFTHLFLVQGMGILPTPGWNGPSWSISCEFVVYGLFAVLTIFGFFKNRLCLTLGVIVTLGIYAGLAFSRGSLNVVYDLGMLRCIAGFYWGSLIYHWSVSRPAHQHKQLHRWELGATAAVFVVMGTVSGPAIVAVIPLLISLVALLRFDSGPVARILLARPIQYLGSISYSIYMVHELVVLCVRMALKRMLPTAYMSMMQRTVITTNPWVGDALVVSSIAAVVIFASCTYVLIETPGRSFGRTLLGHGEADDYRRQRQIAVHSPTSCFDSTGATKQ